jgi:hypothetical protein
MGAFSGGELFILCIFIFIFPELAKSRFIGMPSFAAAFLLSSGAGLFSYFFFPPPL